MATVDDARELLTSGDYKIGLGAREGEYFRMHPERIWEELRRRGARDDDEAARLCLGALNAIGGHPQVHKIKSRAIGRNRTVRELLYYVPADQVG